MGTVAYRFVPLGQSGKNVAVSYSVFFQGLSAIATVNGSQLQVTPTGSTTSLRLADLASSVVMKSGATLSGPLTLVSDPAVHLAGRYETICRRES